jgi:hypothetical protein
MSPDLKIAHARFQFANSGYQPFRSASTCSREAAQQPRK